MSMKLAFLFLSFFIFFLLAISGSCLEEVRRGEVIVPEKVPPLPCHEVLPGYAFSEKTGFYPHVRAYKIDPVTGEEVTFGFCFLSTDLISEDAKKLQPLKILIGMDLDRRIVNFKILEENEYKPYLLFDLGWLDQIKGKSLQDPWEYGVDVEALLYAYKGTYWENLAIRFLENIKSSSEKIANMYITDEVLDKADAYALNRNQVDLSRTVANKEQTRLTQLQPSQDESVEKVFDEKINQLSDSQQENKMTGNVVLQSSSLPKETLFWIFLILALLGFVALLVFVLKSF